MFYKIKYLITNLLFLQLKPVFDISKSRLLNNDDLQELPDSLHHRRYSKDSDLISLKSPFKLILSILSITPDKTHNFPNIRKRTVITVCLMLLRVIVSLTPPVLLQQVIIFIDDPGLKSQVYLGVALIMGLALSTILEALIISHYFFNSFKLKFSIANILYFKLFRKNLSLTEYDLKNFERGERINHIGADTFKASESPIRFIEFCHDMLLVVTANVLLFSYLGWANIAPLILLLMLAPISKATSRKFAKIDIKRNQLKDKRISVISECFNSIRLIKSFVWEKHVTQEVSEIRKKEVREIKRHVNATVISHSINGAIQILTALSGFSLFLLLGNELTPAIIFPSLALFKMMEEPFGDFTWYIAKITGAGVSLQRIINFLNLETTEKRIETSSESNDTILKLDNINLKLQGDTNVLSNINLSLKKGEKLAIVGPVGAGKSVLLQTMIGDFPYEGKITSNFSESAKEWMTFMPQSPIIINGSVEENILFGKKGNIPDNLIKAVCLESDINQMSAGLKTEIGEKGINLSGGQKQRINLARLAFNQSNLVLLDDPFSALDPNTEKDVSKNLFSNVWKNTAVIFTTHRLHSLKHTDKIVFLENGEISGYGDFQSLLNNHQRFNDFYSEHLNQKETAHQSEKSISEKSEIFETVDDSEENGFIVEEERKFGAVNLGVYRSYIRELIFSRGKFRRMIVLVFLLFVATMGGLIPILQDLWLTALTDSNSSPINSLVQEFVHINIWSDIGIYSILGLSSLFWIVISHYSWLTRALQAAKRIHKQIWHSMLHTNVRFFDTNPSGRIINRFTHDMDEIDMSIGESVKDLIFSLIKTMVNYLFISMIVPFLLLIAPLTILLSGSIHKRYIRATRELKRLHQVSYSPIFSFFNEILTARSQIKTLKLNEAFQNKFSKKIYDNQKVEYSEICLEWWSLQQSVFVSSIVIFTVALGGMFLVKWDILTTSLVSLAMTYSLLIVFSVRDIVLRLGEIQSQMTSVERLEQYKSLPSEHLITTRADEKFMQGMGEIKFLNAKIGYDKKLDPVLNNLNFKFAPKKIYGIIGRTGSGKSTIFQTLMRFTEIMEGEILIDDMNITTVKLSELRKKIAFVPQDPILLSGTIRNNLDPEKKYSNDALLTLMEKYKVIEYLEFLPDGINSKVENSGANLSIGQKQIVCIIRALLTGAKILLLDEATSSLDILTEKMLQKVLTDTCKDKTILLIAHRPESLRYCDDVILVENKQFKVLTSEKESDLTAMLNP